MLKALSIFCILVLPLMSGCTTRYIINKNALVSLPSHLGDTTGKTQIYTLPKPEYPWEYYANDTDLFLFQYSYGLEYFCCSDPIPRVENLHVRGITKEFEDYCFRDANTSFEACKKKLIADNGLQKVNLRRKDILSAMVRDKIRAGYSKLSGSYQEMENEVISNDSLYLTVSSKYIDPYLEIEYVDSAKRMREWAARYAELKDSGRIGEYFDYIKPYPKTTHSRQVMEDMFNRFFKISMVKKYESEQRATTSKGLITSSAGACEDVFREIKIEPKTKQLPPTELTIQVKYILKRTYEPLQIAEKDDPLYHSATYRLNASNGFIAEDKVAFNCVMTSGRFHSAPMSLLARLAGADKASDTGISTTLTNLGFDVDVQSVNTDDTIKVEVHDELKQPVLEQKQKQRTPQRKPSLPR